MGIMLIIWIKDICVRLCISPFCHFFTFHVIFTTRFKFQVKKVELYSAGIFFLKSIFFFAYLSASVFLTTIPPHPRKSKSSIVKVCKYFQIEHIKSFSIRKKISKCRKLVLSIVDLLEHCQVILFITVNFH